MAPLKAAARHLGATLGRLASVADWEPVGASVPAITEGPAWLGLVAVLADHAGTAWVVTTRRP